MIFGKYQLLDLLGRGGMAEVFKAKSYGVEGFEKLLVIKRILPNFIDNVRFVDMFINEAKIAVSLNHANVVQVFDLGKVGDSYYIAMEYVHGMDLSTVIKTCTRTGHAIPIELVAFIGSEVAKGLDYAHRRRDQHLEPLHIIHRDISPHNILISFEGEVKITDFGIAKAKNALVDEKKTIKGKYAYMAPEQARGKDHDRRVDIFSLGVVFYEAIAQKNPLRASQASEVLRRIEEKDYPRIDEACKTVVSEEFAAIVNRAMEPDPDKRYFGASEMYESLIAFLYNTRTRVGAHSLAKFLTDLRKDAQQKQIIGDDDNYFVVDLGIDTGTATSTGLAYDYESSEITSVQVPTGGGTSTGDILTPTTGTGTRSLSAELREITILAIEFVGLSAPHEVLERFRSIIMNSGGSVVDERNELLVGFFGLEVADGRDTQDAISTALKLQRAAMMDEAALPLQIGVGVYPDKIVLLGNGRPREDDTYFNAITDARNLAKRGVGCVITSESGRQLASDYFQFEDVTVTAIGGEEQTVCKVVGHRSVAETYGRLFGRRQDLRTIGEIMAMVSRGSGRVLALVGEAGTGKTRIVNEVQRRLVGGGHDVGWYETVCLPWRHATPFAAIGSMFRSILAIGEIEPENELIEKVERLRELGLIPEEVNSVASLLGVAREHDIGPEESGRRLRSALIRAASSLCTDKMTVFFWDDLIYIDNESLKILKYLSQSLSHMPILLVLAFRLEGENGWKDIPNFHEIQLHPLSEKESKRMALSRMKARRAPEELLVDVALKSGGNPLYIEEYIKALVANEVIRVHAGELFYDEDVSLKAFPKTLRGLVGARIKQLPGSQHGLLQRAAVMGQRFNVPLFSKVTGVEVGELRPILIGLIDVGLLTRVSANEFAFASALVRDVVYDGIVFSDRRDIHVAVARAIEDMFSDRLDEFVERLADHYREGSERPKAVEYLIKAGEKMATNFSTKAALDYYLKALELLQNVPRPDLDRILGIYLPIGDLAVKTNNMELGKEKMRLAEELAEEIGDQRKLVQIMRINALLQIRSDKNIEAQQYFQRAIELSDEIGDQELRSEVRATAGQVYNRMGDMKKAALYYREAYELSRGSEDHDFLVETISSVAFSEAMTGDLDKAKDLISEAEKLIGSVKNPISRCKFEIANTSYYYMKNEKEKSISCTMRSLEIAKEYGLKETFAQNAHTIGDSYLTLGNYKKAFTYLRMSLETAEEIGYEMLINVNIIYLAFIDALKFDSDEGLAQLEKALTAADERNIIWEQLQGHFFLGRIYFERKQFDRAKSHLQQSIRIGATTANRRFDSQANDILGQIKEFEGDR